MGSVKPLPDQDLAVSYASEAIGPSPGSLSVLAAKTAAERELDLTFTDEDEKLVRAALAAISENADG